MVALWGALRAAGSRLRSVRRGPGAVTSHPPGAPGKGGSGPACIGLSPRMGNSPSTSMGLSNAATENKIQETISDNCVVIFSKTTCGYCKMAKKLFQDMNVNYTAIELDMYENGSQFQDILHQMTGGRTVPRVFINGAFIGGATDTQRLHQEGKLLPLVHQCQMRRAKNSDLPCSLP
ncbi:glutaredoxin 2 isoform X1 [Mauremys reevesii]|uniref:glutaredoxin 2 isoform X1 n=2 Tax=Mauremys reevesii TaxID=260615 RepID=UPI00193EE5E1|nr:glutaredoxin 2 isoform X1 [Mauremys reevesii]